MVMLTAQAPETTYDILDDRGERIGRVTLPLDPAVVGIGKGTVYLTRPAFQSLQAKAQ